MEATVETLAEARQVIMSSRNLCRHAGYKMGHAVDSCGCGVCTTYRLLGQCVQELGYLEKPQQEQNWW